MNGVNEAGYTQTSLDTLSRYTNVTPGYTQEQLSMITKHSVSLKLSLNNSLRLSTSLNNNHIDPEYIQNIKDAIHGTKG